MVPHLHLISLGAPLLLTEAGDQIRFRTRKHFALLIRLAVEGGRKFTRDYLMDLLWPDVPAARARHSLAQALTVLKAKVGREHLLIQRASVGLAPGAVEADLGTLDAGEPAIRGQFLDGFEVPGAVQFEQWKDEWRAKLMPRIRDSLVKQMDAGRRIGDFAAVEKHAQLLLELDPLSEDAVRGVMEARAWVGDRSNALKVYARYEAQMAEELRAKPSADLMRMANLLREGRRAAPRPDGAAAGQVSERQERRFEAETLIGRETEFSCLYDAWLEVRRREPRIVVVLGDPGVGKTTLVNAFVSTCQMEGAAIARAQAYEAERELPFAVLAELIKQLTVQRAIGGADPEALSELTRVSPEIFAAFPGVPKPVEWAAEVIPLRLADSFLKAVEAATEESPLVLVVDDIHAADNASAAILHVVARKLPRARLLLILTGRPTELRVVATAGELVSDGRVTAIKTLDLEPLSEKAAERLVGSVVQAAGGSHAQVPVPRILQAGKGNPLALELLAREWLAHGSASLLAHIEALNTQPAASIGIPRAIGAVFDRQVGRLGAATRAALYLAAVLGRRLADLPLYQVVELSPASASEALSRLRDEGLLREIQGGLEFRNELIRAQAYYAIAGPARQRLHKRAGELLASRTAERKSLRLEIAWHYLRAGEFTLAVACGVEGAEAALRVGAPYEAERILQALSPWPWDEAITRRIRLLLAKALVDQSKAAPAIPILDDLRRDSGLSRRDAAEAARMRASCIYLMSGDSHTRYPEAADEALVTARATGDIELIVRALLESAKAGAETGDERPVTAAQAEVQELVRARPGKLLPIAWYTLGYCHYLSYDVDRAATCLGRAIELLNRSPNSVLLSMAHNALGLCRYGACDFATAESAFLEALNLAQKMGDDARASLTATNIAGLYLVQGKFSHAAEMGCWSARLGAGLTGQPRMINAYMNVAEAFMMCGRKEDAAQYMELAKNHRSGNRTWKAELEFLCENASLALIGRDTSLALEIIASAETAAAGREAAVPEPAVFAKLRAFRVMHSGGPDAARPLVEQALDRFRGRHLLYFLEVLAAKAWLEKLINGSYLSQTSTELGLFDRSGAHGLKARLAGEGFLA